MINLTALLIAIHQAYVARKISTEFAETDYISRAMSLIVVVALLVIPVSLISSNNSSVQFFIVSSFVSTVAYSLLFFIFLPKILHRSERSSIAKAIRRAATSKDSESHQSERNVESPVDNSGEIVVLHPQLHAQLAEANDELKMKVCQLENAVSELTNWVQELGGSADTIERRRLLEKERSKECPSP